MREKINFYKMLDIKVIRENPEKIKKMLTRKFVSEIAIEEVLSVDEKRRELLQKVEVLSAKQNEVSKQVPNLSGAEKEKVLSEMKKISEERKELEGKLEKV